MSELKAYIAPTPDGTGLADYYLKSEADKVIAELKDKCQMHDFFWEGCGFAKRGFKNTIAVSEAFDKLEAENVKLKEFAEDACLERDDNQNAIDELQAENAELKAKLEEQESENESLLQQNRELCQALQVMYSKEAYDKQKYKRCLAMASNCRLRARWFGDNAFYKKEQWALQWHRRWLELAKKFKPINRPVGQRKQT